MRDAIGLALIVVGVSLLALPLQPLDDTDNRQTGERSGVSLITDHGTGCQYLRTGWGGITPRIGPDGKPVCKVQQ